MKQWEHLMIEVHRHGAAAQVVVTPYQGDIDASLLVVGDNRVALINELGSRGYQLVSVATSPETYWLKRRKQT